MRNLLIATTALVATAGMAAAEITLSGGARFGVLYEDDGANSNTNVHNRFTLNVDGTAESDSGLEFFARVRVRGGNSGANVTAASTVSAPRVGVTMGNLTIATGNILGAIESQPGLYSGAVGLTGLGWGNLPTNFSGNGPWGWDAFSSGGGGANGVEVIYSAGGIGAHLSMSGDDGQARTALHVSYAISGWTLALGQQSSDVVAEGDTTLLTVGGKIGDVSVGFAHADNEGDNDATRVNAGFALSAATSLAVYYTAGEDINAYGLGFTHSLGGATLAGGIAMVSPDGFEDETMADLGIRFNF